MGFALQRVLVSGRRLQEALIERERLFIALIIFGFLRFFAERG